jgi:putative sterol carrier protein
MEDRIHRAEEIMDQARNSQRQTMKKLSTGRQIFLYVAPFPALAFFKIWASLGVTPSNLTIGSLVIFSYCCVIITIAYRWDKPTYFDWVIGGYFALISICLLVIPGIFGPFLVEYAVTGIYTCLFAAAFSPPLFGRDPFTYHYAKKGTPREFWENPFFIQINRTITLSWSGIFAIAIALSLYPSVVTRALLPLGLILGVGLPFSLRFPDYYLKKQGLPTRAEQRKIAQEAMTSQTHPVEPTLLPKSAWETISRMPDFFNAEAAGDLSAIIGFVVSGSETFEAYLSIQKGGCVLETRPSHTPDLVIRTPAEVWLAIARRELDGQQAFFQKAYQAEGDLGLLLRMKQIFRGRPSSLPEDA